MRRPWLFPFFMLSLQAAQTPPATDPTTLLLQVRKKVLLTVNSLPKYLCTETVTRSVLQPVGPIDAPTCDDLAALRKKSDWKVRQAASDRLRLDVAVSGDGEMYSWVGENRFQDLSLADLVGGGATSTGAFASFLGSIFGSNDARFTYNGVLTENGLALAEFGFVVPLAKSRYSVGDKLHHAMVPYDGTFLVDPTSFALVRLTVHADQLPPELHACDDTTTLDYQSIRLNDSEFLLPTSARLLAAYANGSELENQTAFSGCHEFHGESTLHFDAPFKTAQPAADEANSKAMNLPPGMPFTVVLTQSIDTTTAAAGDPIQAKLTKALRDHHRKVLVPANATVGARIIEIERLYGSEHQSLRVRIRLETIAINGRTVPFNARLESLITSRANPAEDPALTRLQDPGAAERMIARADLGSFNQMQDPQDAPAGFLLFEDATNDYIIRSGLAIEGKTAVALH